LTTRAVARTEQMAGEVRVPGDKSIAHRALILGAASSGRQTVEGLPDAADVHSTAECLRSLGCAVEWNGSGRASVEWTGPVQGAALDAGNSGTTARLLAGLAAGMGVSCAIDGDESLRSRPMGRISDPLSQMGARVATSAGGTLPLKIEATPLTGTRYELPVASAQVKSAVLIAGLFAAGETTIIEPVPTRDHTERMLEAMGVTITRAGREISIRGGQKPRAGHVVVPGDFSSAACFIVAALCVPNARVKLPATGVNPTRSGLLDVIRRMGGDVTVLNERHIGGEPMADLVVGHGTLRGITIDDPELIASMVDEFPLFAVAAACANGVTTVRGAQELRRKESDRIDAIVRNLRTLGAEIAEFEDGFSISGPTRLRATPVQSFGDHRIAMSMAIAGLVAEGTTEIDGADAVDISYPEFFDDLHSLVTGT